MPQLDEPMDLGQSHSILTDIDFDVLPPGEPFPNRGRLPDPDYREEFGATSETYEAAMRPKIRANKFIERDEPQELLNADLVKWNNEYLHNMFVARKQKQQNKLSVQAKKNAILWVLDQGINSVGLGVGISQETHPLHCFSGKQLFETLCGRQVRSTGRKRSYSLLEGESGDEGRRVRTRGERQHNDEDIVADADGLTRDVS
jgi:meiotic recombination protein REC8, fungi type